VHLLRHGLDFVAWKGRRVAAAALKEICCPANRNGQGSAAKVETICGKELA
jgi:hypothetical protein